MNKKIIRNFIMIASTILLFSNTSFATTMKAELPGLNKDYKNWINLPEEERNKTKMPNTYTVGIKNSIVRSRFNKLLKGAVTEPEFNLADNIDINVKDQEETNTCWAFAATSTLETYLAMKNNNMFDTYSPRHMEYTMSKDGFLDGENTKGLNRELDVGANTYVSSAYYVSGKGPVLEEDMPFENNKDKINLSGIDKTVRKSVKGYRRFPEIYKTRENDNIIYSSLRDPSAGIIYTESEVEAIRNEVKEHIKTYGAVTVSMGIDINYMNIEKVASGITDKYAFYCDSNTTYPGHSITLVGWDDNFSKENFNDEHKPVHDGAWIILNSWGTDEKSYSNDGYLYISYDDSVVELDMVGMLDVTDIDYDNLYEHDEFGGITELYMNQNTLHLANVYDVKEKGQEELKEVGVQINDTQNVEIYVNTEDDDFSKLEKVAAPGILEPGYHSIKLTTPKTITGDKFIVVAKVTNTENVKFPVEYNPISNGEIPQGAITFFDVVTAERGESFISADGIEFIDLLDLPVGIAPLKDVNLCVKAYTSSINKEPEKVTNISLNKTDLILEETKTEQLLATVAPETAENKEVTWTSSNPNIATVDESGNVTAVANGNCIITVSSNDTPEVKATCNVTVLKQGDFILSLDKESAIMNKGEELTLVPEFYPSEVSNKKVTWSSSNEDVATVDTNGKVIAINEGTTTITVTSQEDTEKTATCEITVKDKISVESVSIDIKSKELYIGDTVKLNATINPEDATDKKISWKSSDNQIATVDESGNVTAMAKGTATITVTTNDGNKTDTSTITVKELDTEVKVESISFNKTKIDIQVGDTASLAVTFTPANASNKNVTWKVADTSIATVDKNGIITAVKTGKTTLTATTVDGNKTAEAEINVIKKTNTDDDIYKPDNKNPGSNDDTIANGKLPAAGKMTITVVFILLAGYGVIRFIKYYKLRDIK